MEVKRHKGYVVSCDFDGNKVAWKIKVKDPTSPYNSRKLPVSSVRKGQELVTGLDVSFQVGRIGRPSFLAAMDVCANLE